MNRAIEIAIDPDIHPTEMGGELGMRFPPGALLRAGPFNYRLSLNPAEPEHRQFFRQHQNDPALRLFSAKGGSLGELDSGFGTQTVTDILAELGKADNEGRSAQGRLLQARARLAEAEGEEAANLDVDKFTELRRATREGKAEVEDFEAAAALWGRKMEDCRARLKAAVDADHQQAQDRLRQELDVEAEVFNAALASAYQRWAEKTRLLLPELDNQPRTAFLRPAIRKTQQNIYVLEEVKSS